MARKRKKSNQVIDRLNRRIQKRALAATLNTLSPNEVAEQIRKGSDGFLLSPEWKALRRQAIELYGTTCCKCGKEQTRRHRVNMDHIKPRKYYPELALDINNLQPLCGYCNRDKGNKTADYRSLKTRVIRPTTAMQEA